MVDHQAARLVRPDAIAPQAPDAGR